MASSPLSSIARRSIQASAKFETALPRLTAPHQAFHSERFILNQGIRSRGYHVASSPPHSSSGSSPSYKQALPSIMTSRPRVSMASSSHPPLRLARNTTSLPLSPFHTSFSRRDASTSASSSRTDEQGAPEDEGHEKPSFRQRMRYLWKRYGWWAIGVYNLWSLVDFSLTWAVIHLFGAEHIRQLETKVRHLVGLDKRQTPDDEIAAWPLTNAADVGIAIVGESQKTHENNEVAAKEAAKRLSEGVDERQAHHPNGSHSSNGGSGTLWAEAVLAYTIHKTLLLPFRVMGTGAVTPSFVNWMVRLGWAKPLPPLKKVASASSNVASTGAKRAAEGGASVAASATKKL